MSTHTLTTVDTDALRERLEKSPPEPRDPRAGYVLVNVLDEDAFEKAHIPGSINIPAGKAEEFGKRYHHDKGIVVYCASTDCDASPKVARQLMDEGFTDVTDFEAGMAGWKDAGLPIEKGGR